MRQIWITAAGAPETLEVRESADPEAGSGEVRIRVGYSGVNFADIQARLGQYPDAPPIPCVVGYEVSGVIDQVGAGVTGLEEGDRVLALSKFGGYSDLVPVNAEWVQKLPADVSLEAGAALPVNYATAWTMLVRQGGLRRGDTVLIHSAGGGVGLAALQICLWKGAVPIGTASAGKHERLRQAGYAHCIDYRTEDFEAGVMKFTEGRGVDIVLDPQGGKSFRKSYRCLAPLGRLYLFGAADLVAGKTRSPVRLLKVLLQTPFFHPLDMLNTNRGVQGINMGRLFPEFGRMRGDLEEIVRKTAEGVFSPVVDKVFSFDDAAAAHQYIQDRRNFGKVLLEP